MSKVQLQGNVSGTGVFTIASPNSNTDRTLTLPNETGTILTSGGAIAGTTGTFSGIIQANGGGIQFPATQVPSADANTLDDYEEGTWTPSISSGGWNTSGQVVGRYIKIGRQVTLYVFINLGTGGNSSAFHILGVPFLPITDNFACGTADIGRVSKIGAYARIDSGSNFFQFLFPSGSTSTDRGALLGTDLGSSYVIATITYFTTN
jgi:hypothetical protein